ncbi:MAG: hypothetical protein C0391_04100 [Anaerolinea sp.]|nr:hypothetical protein [Anaerolinea sp.]
MTKQYQWNELLVIGGYQFSAISETAFDFSGEHQFNMEHLENLLKAGDVDYHLEVKKLKISSQALDLHLWISLLKGLFAGGMENGPVESLVLDNVEVPMMGIIGQLKRLGLKTVGCCCGHENGRNRKPYVEFENPTSAFVFQKLLQNSGYSAQMKGTCTVRILEKQGSLYEIGLALSNIKETDTMLGELLQKREAVLETLLLFPGKSGNEELIRAYVLCVLKTMNVHYWQDDFGNVLGYKRYGEGPAILLSAHLDIYDEIPSNSHLINDGSVWRRNIGILGADDRAGVAIIINILDDLRLNGFSGTIKFALTVQEEIGQIGAEHIDKAFFDDVDYAISLDRKGNCDIVTKSKRNQLEYCSEEYGKVFEQTSIYLGHNIFNYKMTNGGVSDLRIWSALGIPSVNLSIGYYNEHTDSEYLCINEWQRLHDLVLRALEKLMWEYRQKMKRDRKFKRDSTKGHFANNTKQ